MKSLSVETFDDGVEKRILEFGVIDDFVDLSIGNDGQELPHVIDGQGQVSCR